MNGVYFFVLDTGGGLGYEGALSGGGRRVNQLLTPLCVTSVSCSSKALASRDSPRHKWISPRRIASYSNNSFTVPCVLIDKGTAAASALTRLHAHKASARSLHTRNACTAC